MLEATKEIDYSHQCLAVKAWFLSLAAATLFAVQIARPVLTVLVFKCLLLPVILSLVYSGHQLGFPPPQPSIRPALHVLASNILLFALAYSFGYASVWQEERIAYSPPCCTGPVTMEKKDIPSAIRIFNVFRFHVVFAYELLRHEMLRERPEDFWEEEGDAPTTTSTSRGCSWFCIDTSRSTYRQILTHITSCKSCFSTWVYLLAIRAACWVFEIVVATLVFQFIVYFVCTEDVPVCWSVRQVLFLLSSKRVMMYGMRWGRDAFQFAVKFAFGGLMTLVGVGRE